MKSRISGITKAAEKGWGEGGGGGGRRKRDEDEMLLRVLKHSLSDSLSVSHAAFLRLLLATDRATVMYLKRAAELLLIPY